MKEGKTVVMTVFVVILILLVAGLGYMTINDRQSQTAQTEVALSNLRNRIEQLKTLKEEQTLTRDVMLLQQEIKRLTAIAQGTSFVEPQFVPKEQQLPPKVQELD